MKELLKKFTDSLFMYAVLWWIWDTCIRGNIENKSFDSFIEQLFNHFERKIAKSLVHLSLEVANGWKTIQKIPEFVLNGGMKLIAEMILFVAQKVVGMGTFKKLSKKTVKVLIEIADEPIEYKKIQQFILAGVLNKKKSVLAYWKKINILFLLIIQYIIFDLSLYI